MPAALTVTVVRAPLVVRVGAGGGGGGGGAVSSVDGRTGVVTLSDLYEASGAVGAHEADPAPHSGHLAALLVTRSGAGGAGSTTSTAVAASGSRALAVIVSVTQAFDAGATGKVGFSDDDDAVLGVADLDASVLSTVGLYHFVVDVPATGTRAIVVSTTGSSTQGSMRVITQLVAPET